jgi:hypothetical protein
LGLHPRSGAAAVAPGKRGGHHHRVEQKASAVLKSSVPRQPGGNKQRLRKDCELHGIYHRQP